MDQPDTSDVLRELLVRQGMRGTTGATGGLHGKKARGAANEGARSQLRQREVTADGSSEKDRRGEAPAKLKLVWNMPMRQTTQTPRAVARRGVVSLMVIEGGKR